MHDIDQPLEGESLHTSPTNSLEQNLPGEALASKVCACGLRSGLCDHSCEVVGVSPTEGL